jgi:hypothetical protein
VLKSEDEQIKIKDEYYILFKDMLFTMDTYFENMSKPNLNKLVKNIKD